MTEAATEPSFFGTSVMQLPMRRMSAQGRRCVRYKTQLLF